MLFEIVDKLQINISIFVVIKGQRGDQIIKIFNKIAENRDFVFLLNEVDRAEQKFFLEFVIF